MSDEDLPQPDQIEGAPHPRETERLVGQNSAEDAFLVAYNSERLHHAWMITGPQGVGKRFVLCPIGKKPKPSDNGIEKALCRGNGAFWPRSDIDNCI